MNGGPSSNGRGADAWRRSWTQLVLDRRSASYCRVTFEHPPVEAIMASTTAELSELVDLIEQDVDLNVVVFDSVRRDFYLGRFPVAPPDSDRARAWLDLLARLRRVPVVTIASIRGRARGAGRQVALACDLRFYDRLDEEVDEVAFRLARLDHASIARAKSRAAGWPEA